MKLPAPLILGLSAPACTLVARELLRRDCADPQQPLLVVVPTKDAVRLLREQLAVEAAAGAANGAFICPRIISAGQLTAEATTSAAPPMLQQAVLCCVLKREHGRFPQLTPQADQWSDGDWLARAGQVRRLFSTLGHEGILPAGLENPAARALADSSPLWLEIFTLYPHYQQELHRHGLNDPAEGRALTLEEGTHVILACVPSLSERARQLLEHSGHAVEVWLHTDELHEGPGWFDAWGRPGENWLATPAEDVLGLDTEGWQERFRICGDMERMAAETALAAGRAGSRVAVGVCDSGMEAAVAQAFACHNVRTVRPRGIPFTATAWHRLLLTLTRTAELLELGEKRADNASTLPAEAVCELLRNPIVADGLHLEAAASAALSADKLRARCLPSTLGQMLRLANDDTLAQALGSIAGWLSCLDSAPALLRGLQQLAGEQFISGAPAALKDECALAASFTEQVNEACRSLLESPWARELSPLSTLHLLCSAGPPAHSSHPLGALSLRGWLELTYAPEETLLLAGLHDGIIPERWPASPYITPQVIEALGLPRDEARAARDAYLLRSLYCCRPGRVYAFFTLLNARRDPLFPSSTFFRLTPQHHLAALVHHFFDRSKPCPATAPAAYDSSGWHYRRLALPVQEDETERLARLTLRELGLENPMAGKSFSPSALKQFLACPLRFWVARLNGVQDEHISPTQRDLDAREIGDCLHAALEDFVKRYPGFEDFRNAHREAGDDATLRPLVQREMEAAFRAAYERLHGKAELMPQQFQCDAMLRRLAACAELHWQLWMQGWECARDAGGTLMVEYDVRWEFDGHPLHFRIDRIDRRNIGGHWEYRVIDYKTGDIDSCYKNHLEELPKPHERPDLRMLDERLEPAVGPGRGKHAELRWKDLQLPLYTAWALSYFAGSSVSSAYIHLSRRPAATRVVAWGDSPKDPPFFTPRSVPANAAYPYEVVAEPLYDNALRWIRFGLEAMAEGRCLVSAEMLCWKAPKTDRDVFGDILRLEPLAKAFLTFPTP